MPTKRLSTIADICTIITTIIVVLGAIGSAYLLLSGADLKIEKIKQETSDRRFTWEPIEVTLHIYNSGSRQAIVDLIFIEDYIEDGYVKIESIDPEPPFIIGAKEMKVVKVKVVKVKLKQFGVEKATKITFHICYKGESLLYQTYKCITKDFTVKW